MLLLFASGNPHKLHEMRFLLPGYDIQSPSEAGYSFMHEETADTFLGNALGKAEALHAITGMSTLADDSGLVVDALGGRPGIHTARFGSLEFGRELDAREKYEYLLDIMKLIPLQERSARFVCSLALVLSPYRRYVIQETVEGHIALEPRGRGGFGYDPVFIATGTDCTMAELPEQEKHRVSHRGKASLTMLALLNQLTQQSSDNGKTFSNT